MGTCRAATFLSLCAVSVLLLGSASPNLAAQSVNVTTWHQDIPAICTGCVYRTGQNLQESALTNVNKSTFGQYCYYNLDGQVFGQPLVVTNVQVNGTVHPIVVYVVTMNGSVYAFDGSPSTPTNWPVGQCGYGQTQGPILQKSLLSVVGSGSTAASCAVLGGGGCITIAPNVGILGTPVVNANTGGNTTTGTLYLVLESELTNGTTITFSHTLFALDITSLAATATVPYSCTDQLPDW
jgi:hypothetical protein